MLIFIVIRQHDGHFAWRLAFLREFRDELAKCGGKKKIYFQQNTYREVFCCGASPHFGWYFTRWGFGLHVHPPSSRASISLQWVPLSAARLSLAHLTRNIKHVFYIKYTLSTTFTSFQVVYTRRSNTWDLCLVEMLVFLYRYILQPSWSPRRPFRYL